MIRMLSFFANQLTEIIVEPRKGVPKLMLWLLGFLMLYLGFTCMVGSTENPLPHPTNVGTPWITPGSTGLDHRAGELPIERYQQIFAYLGGCDSVDGSSGSPVATLHLEMIDSDFMIPLTFYDNGLVEHEGQFYEPRAPESLVELVTASLPLSP